MNSTNIKIISARENPELVDQAESLIEDNWPEFMLHDPVAKHFSECYEKLPEYQYILLDKNTSQAAAICNSIPLSWEGNFDDLPDNGWDWAMSLGIDDLRMGRKTRILSALQIVVFKNYRGQNISAQAVESMRRLASEQGFNDLIAPVRPTLKSQYPLASIENFINWKNADGWPFDPWLRVHCRAGGEIIKTCGNSMRITGTVAHWQEWTGIRFFESGRYIIPGALVPVDVDYERDICTYIEPNVWIRHSL